MKFILKMRWIIWAAITTIILSSPINTNDKILFIPVLAVLMVSLVTMLPRTIENITAKQMVYQEIAPITNLFKKNTSS